MASDHEASQLEKGLSASSSMDSDAHISASTTCVPGISRVWSIVGRALPRLGSLRLPWIQEKVLQSHLHGRMADSKVRSLQDFPKGFPKVACFLDSDDAFMVYRRFGFVFSRLLLRRQDEIRRIEAMLEAMDKTDLAEGNEKYLMSHKEDDNRESFPKAWGQESRTKLMDQLEEKALQFAELLLKNQRLKALSQPSTRDYRSVLHFMENDGGQLFEAEGGFIYDKEDLITLKPGREHAWLDGIVERLLRNLRCRLTTFIFCSKETIKKTDDPSVHYYDRRRISTFVTMIIMSMILTLLIIPIWLLYKFSVMGIMATSPKPVCTVLVFTSIFAIVISAFTPAKRQEILAASAAYCAVLVVFLGNVAKFAS